MEAFLRLDLLRENRGIKSMKGRWLITKWDVVRGKMLSLRQHGS